ncbi:MAG TPA: tetratricopeptide repeat protein [Vicinamibacterales bacterium]|jgi:tetratricopeptide (TPR) repeat protein
MSDERRRIDDLRRRVQKDPASIAFAQLAEELRRAGELQEAVRICRDGLEIHPTYLSARVTLGRALLELNQLDEAVIELEHVLTGAPTNLAAARGLGEIYSRRGEIDRALTHYRAALALAPNDPDLEETVASLTRRGAAQAAPAHAAPVEPETTTDLASITPEPEPLDASDLDADVDMDLAAVDDSHEDAGADVLSFVPSPVDSTRERATRTVAVLETWLDAIHGSRSDRRA